ncbi:lysophospholipase L1-like esterase [Kribbella rubisoli]|uniref:Lysophospholipase L1-like esterase n=1 Tax=Kribbella rubisoli TaxID=3075929 RepID=A0A4Q7WQA1_9ACTN|nr:GDSL-type esterase/lipase family protein [Kribbella rubisoli]RZU11379.1 lysophospholipase L1-like esterase [Kribbella rubisoli]
MTIPLRRDTTVLFIGDSITDAGRNRDYPDSLGSGYAAMAAGWFAATNRSHNLHFYNRGIGGNRTGDLLERWEDDCVSLEPDVVSILVGVNDVLRRYDSDDVTSLEQFTSNYRSILSRTAELGAKVIVIEPFLVPVRPEIWAWRDDLDPKLISVRQLAAEFDATLLPADGLLAAASADSEPKAWAGDGVHPTVAGHALLAQAWLAATRPAA